MWKTHYLHKMYANYVTTMYATNYANCDAQPCFTDGEEHMSQLVRVIRLSPSIYCNLNEFFTMAMIMIHAMQLRVCFFIVNQKNQPNWTNKINQIKRNVWFGFWFPWFCEHLLGAPATYMFLFNPFILCIVVQLSSYRLHNNDLLYAHPLTKHWPALASVTLEYCQKNTSEIHWTFMEQIVHIKSWNQSGSMK